MPIPSSLGEYQSQVANQIAAAGSRLTAAITGGSSLKDTLSLNSVKNKLFSKASGTGGSKEPSGVVLPYGTDLRVRISLPPESPKFFYLDEDNQLLAPLKQTSGFIFPIQPQIALGYEASYQETTLTHSNFPYYNYQNSKLTPIQITGDFPIRTTFDANYVMAGIHFLRTCTRMFNGQDGVYAGAPPMVLRLNGLGFSGYDNLPVVITSFTATYTDSVDFISFKPFGGYAGNANKPGEIDENEVARLPVVVQISLQLNPVFSRKFITNSYSTLNYSKGTVRLLGKNSSSQTASTTASSTATGPVDTQSTGAPPANALSSSGAVQSYSSLEEMPGVQVGTATDV